MHFFPYINTGISVARVPQVGHPWIRTMDEKLKERVIIEFPAKEGCAPKEIPNRLKNVYGDAVMDISNVRHWVKKFRNEETEITDKPRSGRPIT